MRGRSDPTIAVLPAIPAGSYRIRVEGGGPGGWLMLGIGQDQFALRSEAITWPAPPIEIAFPVDVRALIVRGDEDARRAVRRVVVEPLSVLPARARLTDLIARRAVKYAGVSVFFLDDRSFAEPEGFWIGGSRQSAFVVQPDRLQSSVDLHAAQCARRQSPDARIGPVARGGLTLAPGEERHMQSAARSRSASGARDGDDDLGVPSVGIDARQPRRPVLGVGEAGTKAIRDRASEWSPAIPDLDRLT